MDVVKNNIEQVGDGDYVQQLNQGTKFLLRIPFPCPLSESDGKNGFAKFYSR